MTALNTPIVFNNSTGSDTQMSGSPSTRTIPSTLTLQITSGSNVAYGGASGTINPGDLVYAPNQSSGRKFNVVASINTSVSPTEYTFDDNWDASDFSATCYSGGKRAGGNLSSDAIWGDAPSGAVIEIEHTGTDYSLSGQWIPNNSGAVIKIKGTGSSKPRIIGDSGLGQGIRVNNGTWMFENLVFVHERAGGTLMQTTYGTATYNLFVDCEFTHEGSSAGGTLIETGKPFRRS